MPVCWCFFWENGISGTCINGMLACGLALNNKLAEAVTFAQAQVCIVCVPFSRWLNCFALLQQRAFSLESTIKYKEYFKITNYLPISFMPTGFETSSIQTQAHDCGIGFVWVPCTLCLQNILIKQHGGSPIFNCLHTELLLLLLSYAKRKLEVVVGLVLFSYCSQ